MDYLLRGAHIYDEIRFSKKDILIKGGAIADIAEDIIPASGVPIFHLNNCFVFPGLIDVHVHLREPGFFYKESIKSGTMAAARGGFTSVCAMPNLDPVPDGAEHLKIQTDIIERDAAVRVYPYGSITVGECQGELSDMAVLAGKVVAFSDDGVGVSSGDMMRCAMTTAKGLNKMIVAHCEDLSLIKGKAVHDGEYARLRGIAGISSESEWRQVERDIGIVREIGCGYHVCHVSTKESVELIRSAKAEGLPVSCETAPHYLTLCDEDLRDDGSFRMNPPIRSAADKRALIDGIKDGTIEIIATDHAPHSREEKSHGLIGSKNGIVGLETAFPVLYTKLVKTGIITLVKLIELMHTNPSKRFKIGSPLKVGERANLTVFDLDAEYEIDPEDFLSKGRSTPFAGWRVFGRCLLTISDGKIAYKDDTL